MTTIMIGSGPRPAARGRTRRPWTAAALRRLLGWIVEARRARPRAARGGPEPIMIVVMGLPPTSASSGFTVVIRRAAGNYMGGSKMTGAREYRIGV